MILSELHDLVGYVPSHLRPQLPDTRDICDQLVRMGVKDEEAWDIIDHVQDGSATFDEQSAFDEAVEVIRDLVQDEP